MDGATRVPLGRGAARGGPAALRLLLIPLLTSSCGLAVGSPEAGVESGPVEVSIPAPDLPSVRATSAPTAAPPPTAASGDGTPPSVASRPAWLGTRPLPLRPDGFGQVQPTPAELRDRRLPPPASSLPDPPVGSGYQATVSTVPDDVLARSTWTESCPVTRADLRYVTLTFWGFDERPHTGELLVNASVADGLVGIFERLYAARFPIEEMRVVAPEELTMAPTGDGNNTTAFVCRAVRGGATWSAHAFGLAVDVNPFHNPYVKDDLVLPELAGAYVQRDPVRAGMLVAGHPAVDAFVDAGWTWGGLWARPVDHMHLSADGR